MMLSTKIEKNKDRIGRRVSMNECMNFGGEIWGQREVGEMIHLFWDLSNLKSPRDLCMEFLNRTPADGAENLILFSKCKDCPYFCAAS